MVQAAPVSTLRLDRVPVLLNPGAGSAPAERIDEIGHLFAEAGIHADIETVPPAQLQQRIRELTGNGIRAIAIGGGDGTISSAVNVLAGSEIVLIPLPLGTLNHFANRYGMGTLEAVRAALLDGAVTAVPVGEVNGRTFVNNASCGFYPHMVRHRDRIKSLLTKWPAAFVATLFVMLKRPLIEVLVQTEQQRIHRTTTAVWIGLGRDSLRLPIPGDASKEGELLEVVIPRPHSRLRLFLVALRLWFRLRRHKKPLDSQIEVLRARQFELHAGRPIDLATDGEPCMLGDRLEFRYHPEAVRLLCMVAPS